jgi:hypothetical protein
LRRRILNNQNQELSAYLAEFRQFLRSRVDQHINQYAAIIRLDYAAPQFEQDVTEALQWGILASFEGLKPKRYSDIRKELSRVGKEAKEAERSLRRLRAAFDNLSPAFKDGLLQKLNPVEKISLAFVTRDPPSFHALSSVARKAQLIAEALNGTDKGGAPQNLPFKMLILYLARGFQKRHRAQGEGNSECHRPELRR